MEIPITDISSILEMVDTFYNNAWDKLIIIIIIVGGIFGVAVPIILKVLSDYRARIQEDKLEKNLSEQVQNLSNENVKLIEKKLGEYFKEKDKVVSQKLETAEMKISVSRGLIFHTLGTLMAERKYTKSSLKYFFAAFNNYFDGKDEENMQNIVLAIKEQYNCIGNLSLFNEIKVKHLKLIKKLNKINEHSRYSNTINEMEEEFNSLKKRLTKKG
jgi:hypothetical protein